MLKSFLISFILTLATIFSVHNWNAYADSFDRVEQGLQETEHLLATYRQELDTLHFAIHGTHLEKDF